MAWRLHIEDKHHVKGKEGEDLFCPPHRVPHKLPFTEPIHDEPCHIHKSPWRMAHHIPTCIVFKCKNYHRMMEEHVKRREEDLMRRKKMKKR